MVVPLFKIAALALKQMTKPVSKNLLVYASDHPGFRKFCARVGNRYNKFTQALQGRKNVRDLGEDAAVSVGTEALTEVCVVIVASVIVLLEVMRQSVKEETKVRALEEKFQNIGKAIQGLNAQYEELANDLRALRALQVMR
eukprot:RCo022742